MSSSSAHWLLVSSSTLPTNTQDSSAWDSKHSILKTVFTGIPMPQESTIPGLSSDFTCSGAFASWNKHVINQLFSQISHLISLSLLLFESRCRMLLHPYCLGPSLVQAHGFSHRWVLCHSFVLHPWVLDQHLQKRMLKPRWIMHANFRFVKIWCFVLYCSKRKSLLQLCLILRVLDPRKCHYNLWSISLESFQNRSAHFDSRSRLFCSPIHARPRIDRSLHNGFHFPDWNFRLHIHCFSRRRSSWSHSYHVSFGRIVLEKKRPKKNDYEIQWCWSSTKLFELAAGYLCQQRW